jgi:hypothetical protein
MDSNASFAGEVERNVSRDNDSLLRGQFLKTPPLVVDQSGVSTQRKRPAAARCRYWHGATAPPVSDSGVLPLRDGCRVTVLPQLKVDRLCSVVDGTAGFDPQPT